MKIKKYLLKKTVSMQALRKKRARESTCEFKETLREAIIRFVSKDPDPRVQNDSVFRHNLINALFKNPAVQARFIVIWNET